MKQKERRTGAGLFSICLVLGAAGTTAAQTPVSSVDQSPVERDPATILSGSCPVPVVDTGPSDLVNGCCHGPTLFDPDGLADDFSVPDLGGTSFSCIRVEFGVQPGYLPTFDTMRIRIYPAPGGLPALGNFNAAAPVFDRAYTVAGGDLIVTDTGVDFNPQLDVIDFDGVGPSFDLGPGDYALHVTFPGSEKSVASWLTAVPNGSECAVFWGPVNFLNPSDLCVTFGTSVFESLSFNLMEGGEDVPALSPISVALLTVVIGAVLILALRSRLSASSG
jgi:hypothetical protein